MTLLLGQIRGHRRAEAELAVEIVAAGEQAPVAGGPHLNDPSRRHEHDVIARSRARVGEIPGERS